jgi:putative oxidoreductase
VNPKNLIRLMTRIFDVLWRLSWIPALLTRLFVGYFFFTSGWAKSHDLATFTKNFMEWGIPFPAFNAALSAYTEMIGGALTMVGLATRFVSVAMVINMAVAIISVKMKDVHTLTDFANLDEPLYALVYVWLMFSGAGWLSLDAICKRFIATPSDSRDA